MRNKSPFLRVVLRFLINLAFCGILIAVALTMQIPAFTMTLPVIFFLFMVLQQKIPKIFLIIYITVLFLYFPLLRNFSQLQVSIIYSLFFLTTISNNARALILHRLPPIPSLVPLIFLIIVQFCYLSEKITFALIVAYYLSLLVTLFLLLLSSQNNSNDEDLKQ